MFLYVYVFITTIILSAQCIFNPYPKLELGPLDGDPGEPLFLTQYVESGAIQDGQKMARVPFTKQLKLESYAGYFTVNKTYDSNLFFWYFRAMKNQSDAPVVLWLQGGPGASSLYGLFMENGPLRVHKMQFQRRKYSWAENHHLIYIDNPVGTGFSFTKNESGYRTDQAQVGEDLYNAIKQFLQLFPELQNNPFYVTGESYAGKYVPALAYTIHKNNPDAKLKVNLKGLAIGNGLSDPQHQLLHGQYLYQLGLIDSNACQIFEKYQNKAIDFIKKEKWDDAFDTFDFLLNGDFIGGKSLFYNITGFTSYFNYLHTKDYKQKEDFGPMIQSSMLRKDIHVGNLPFHNGSEVEMHLKQDVMKSVAPWISALLDHYPVVVYNGQLDIIVAYPLTVNYLKNLNFSGAEQYKTAKRYQWKVNGEIAGYVKEAGNLVEVLVRDAGHMVPGDQPKWAFDLISRLTHGKSFISLLH